MSEKTPDLEGIEGAAFLVTHDAGKPNQELTDALALVAAAVKDTRGKGTVTLVIEVKPFAANTESGALSVQVTVTPKAPVLKRAPEPWWADDKGNLVRFSPNQRTLFGDDQPVTAYDPRKDTE